MFKLFDEGNHRNDMPNSLWKVLEIFFLYREKRQKLHENVFTVLESKGIQLGPDKVYISLPQTKNLVQKPEAL